MGYHVVFCSGLTATDDPEMQQAELSVLPLTSALHGFREGVEPVDDQTIIVMQRAAT